MTDDIERRFVFNTPVAAVMELVNELVARSPDDPAARFAAETAVSLIQPYAPHVAEELWSALGHERLWEAAVAGGRRVAARARRRSSSSCQVNGKVRDRLRGAGRAARGRAGRARARLRAACRRT